jgi:ectoine hydroxylase-related dioxygenase (phytanoyl-CoA dioxygenase family)
VLGPGLKLSNLNARSANPGGGARPLHADRAALPDARGSWVCNTIRMFDACTPDNGALGLVPGSHRRGRLPRQALADPLADHPEQVLLTGRAGTVVGRNAQAWHAGTAHRTGRPRASLHAFSCRRDRPRQQDQKRLLRPEVQRSPPSELREPLALGDQLNDRLGAAAAGVAASWQRTTRPCRASTAPPAGQPSPRGVRSPVLVSNRAHLPSQTAWTTTR